MSMLKIEDPEAKQLTKLHYVPFGRDFVLHPRSFVLGTTLEWIRLPRNISGFVVGRSSWGRRGLIIATATGVHPGFTGCLTLEISNVGEIAIAVKPGLAICQLFLHDVTRLRDYVDQSPFIGRRRPVLGTIVPDAFAEKLGRSQEFLE
jgi:dCTP deaminase